ncbi:MAG: ribonuclease P [Nanoarchaeota archaeon]|nr:ribonuclease P [Nanoarchaeota archaeon]MBU1321341.1 ribonuclease P [Nanoarchaeota archaeon]MBU1597264.1 ribonuclease P [Nanoarchaeota archaeon]MBU2441478.1 ribonuclease P [Nanoarchaeota archaeon]
MPIRKHKSKPEKQRKIALEHIEHLFKEAEKMFKTNSKLSDRYVHLARRIAMKYKVKLRSPLKKRFCKHCYKYLVPGSNCRVRLNDKSVTYFCEQCKKFMRFGYGKK